MFWKLLSRGSEMILIMNTCPDKESADKIGKTLVEKKLAACVTIMPTEKSIYRWQGKVEEDKEYLLLIKTKEKLFKRVEIHIKANHPHKVPEIIGHKIDKAEQFYKTWIERSTI
jgi:periplasmic divalent cation tolerance protein